MQIYALDTEKILISAAKAKKQQNYRCLECGNAVRVRSGKHRQAHFYHLQPERRCTLHAKGMPHLQLQYRIKSLIPEAELECRFPSINRIADAAWHVQRIVFEIQYSPMNAEELSQRTQDYRSLGYQVIWIFHDHLYNREKLSSAEDAAQALPHYFSDMDAQGIGSIYDQYAKVERGKRTARLPRLSIDPSKIHFLPSETNQQTLPKQIAAKIHSWPGYFAGDIVDRITNFPNDELQILLKSWEEAPQEDKLLLLFVKQGIDVLIAWYRTLFRFFLEKACQ
jgi:competence protein CoiA